MNWHPFAERFPLLEGDEWEAFKESIAATGGNETPITYRIVNGKKQYLDGRNRHRACKSLSIECREEAVEVDDEDVKAWIIRRNVHRRHMTRELRRELVAELRADGQSTRKIAETLGASRSTVHRDIEEVEAEEEVKTSVPNGTPKPTRTDYPDSLSPTVQKVHAKARIKASPEQLTALAEFDESTQDELLASVIAGKQTIERAIETGEVPPPTVEEIMAAKNSEIEAFCRKVMKLVADEMPDDIWLGHNNRKAGAIEKFKNGCEALRSCKCTAKCPACSGDGCKECLKSGRVTKYVYEQLAR